MTRRRIHPVTQADRQVFDALVSVAVLVEREKRPVTVAEIAKKVGGHPDWIEKRLIAAVHSGHAVKVGDAWTLTADGWDRVGGCGNE